MKHLLIVCKNCGFSADEAQREDETGGDHLIKQLQKLHEHWPRKNEMAIETTGCLCICDRPCAIAYVSTGKPTYLFGGLSPLACAADLLSAGELYLDSDSGMVSIYKLPVALQPHRIARIPPAP